LCDFERASDFSRLVGLMPYVSRLANAAFFSAHPLPTILADTAPHVWEACLAPDADVLDRADIELAHDEDDDEDESDGEIETGDAAEEEEEGGGEDGAEAEAAAAALALKRSPKRGRAAGSGARRR
jgi:hypothetical protein